MQKLFIGAWDLISQQAQRADGTVVYPRGEDAIGRIMYDASGAMGVHLMRVNSEFTDLASFQTAMEGSLSYFGSFRVDEAAKIVTHLVKGSTYAPYIGTELVRTYEFSDDNRRLTLTAQGTGASGQPEIRVLIWQKIG